MSRSMWLAAALVWMSTGGAAQPAADFTGRWTIETPPAPPATAGAPGAQRPDMGSGWGPTITIAQDAKQLAIEYVQFSRYDLQPPIKLVYMLDGSESKNTVMISHASQVQRSRAAWDGAALVITTQHTLIDPASGKPVTAEVTQRLSLQSPTTLVVQVTRAGVLGGQSTTTKTIYRKA